MVAGASVTLMKASVTLSLLRETCCFYSLLLE
jgi:hypothetical protein